MTGWDLDLFWHINRDWTHPVLDLADASALGD